MKGCLIFLLIVGLLTLGIYLRAKSRNTENSAKAEQATSDTITTITTDKLPVDSFIATPKEIAGLIDKNAHQIAEFFHDKGGVSRYDHYSPYLYGASTYKFFICINNENLFVRPQDTLVITYTFREKDQFRFFFDEVKKNASEALTYTVDGGIYSAFKMGNCLFVKNGFSRFGDEYIGTMYSLSKLKSKRSKLTKQSKSTQYSSSSNED